MQVVNYKYVNHHCNQHIIVESTDLLNHLSVYKVEIIVKRQFETFTT